MIATEIAPWTATRDRKEAYALGYQAGRLSVCLEHAAATAPRLWTDDPYVPLGIRIERLLREQPRLRSAEIAARLNETRPTVSTRLSQMKGCGRVTLDRRDLVWSCAPTPEVP